MHTTAPLCRPRPLAARALRQRRGFTLVELALTLTVVALLASLAWPSWTAQQRRSTRLDAIAALQRVHAAQEAFHASNGFYATQWPQLRGSGGALSASGHYRIELEAAAPGQFSARAVALGAQSADTPCTVLRLRVAGALVHHEPALECWLM